MLCRKIGVTEQPYYRWKKEYCSLPLDQAKRRSNARQTTVAAMAEVFDFRDCSASQLVLCPRPGASHARDRFRSRGLHNTHRLRRRKHFYRNPGAGP